MTGNFSTDLIVVYLPTLLAVVMAVVGALRGARREAVVSASILLAALIIIVWGVPWATDLANIFTNFSIGDSRNVLSYIVIALTVLVIGYMLGSALVPRTPISALSRVGGFFLGAANGLAIGGFIIRGQYESALLSGGSSNSELVNILTTYAVSRYLWIWANWFPLAIALIAALVALIGPFRRAQTTVATPAANTDWGPSTAPAATMSAPGPAAYTTGYGQGFTSQYPQVPSQPGQPQYSQQPPYGQYQAPTQAQQYVPSPAAQQYGQYNPTSYNPTPSAPSIHLLPLCLFTCLLLRTLPRRPRRPAGRTPRQLRRCRPRMRPVLHLLAGQQLFIWEVLYRRQRRTPIRTSKHLIGRDTTTEPSWLTPTAPGSSAPSDATIPPAVVDSSLTARAEAPTQAQSIIDPAPVTSGDSSPVSQADDSPDAASVTCSRCGTLVPADATFCTECGNRMTAA